MEKAEKKEKLDTLKAAEVSIEWSNFEIRAINFYRNGGAALWIAVSLSSVGLVICTIPPIRPLLSSFESFVSLIGKIEYLLLIIWSVFIIWAIIKVFPIMLCQICSLLKFISQPNKKKEWWQHFILLGAIALGMYRPLKSVGRHVIDGYGFPEAMFINLDEVSIQHIIQYLKEQIQLIQSNSEGFAKSKLIIALLNSIPDDKIRFEYQDSPRGRQKFLESLGCKISERSLKCHIDKKDNSYFSFQDKRICLNDYIIARSDEIAKLLIINK